MLRITVVESSGEAVRLRVEGRVTDGWVEELRKTCELQGLGDGIRLTLELADVAFVDAAGIELLKELRSRRVTLLNPTSDWLPVTALAGQSVLQRGQRLTTARQLGASSSMVVRAILLPGALLALACLSEAATVRQLSSQTYVLQPQGHVSLQNINGDVRICAWDRNEVLVEASTTASSPIEARIEVDSRPESISIRTKTPGDPYTESSPVDLTIRVPRSARLDEIKLVNGGLDIHGVTGGVNASSLNGTLKAQKIAGDAHLSTVNGKLEASFDRLGGSQTISMDAVNGSIVLSIPPDAWAELTARNVTGGIDNEFGIPVHRNLSAGSQLHGVLHGGKTHITLTNINGGICIEPLQVRQLRTMDTGPCHGSESVESQHPNG